MSDLRSEAREYAAKRTQAEATGVDRVVRDVLAELGRQVELRDAGRFTATVRDCAVCGDHLRALAVLMEEVGEVSTEALSVWPVGSSSDYDAAKEARRRLRAELVQVAACAVGWLQGLDQQAGAWGDGEAGDE